MNDPNLQTAINEITSRTGRFHAPAYREVPVKKRDGSESGEMRQTCRLQRFDGSELVDVDGQEFRSTADLARWCSAWLDGWDAALATARSAAKEAKASEKQKTAAG